MTAPNWWEQDTMQPAPEQTPTALPANVRPITRATAHKAPRAPDLNDKARAGKSVALDEGKILAAARASQATKARTTEEGQPASEDRPTITTIGCDDIFAPLPPIPWIVEKLGLAPGAAAAFAGYGYVGKTVIAQSIALAIAAGRDVFGVFQARPGRVLHLDYEQGRHLTCERYQRLSLGMGIKREDLGDLLRLGIMPSVYLDSPGAADIYARALEGFRFAIVDSLRASAPSADENSSEVRRHIDVLTRASELTGCLPLFIHHARKPANDEKKGKRGGGKGGAKMSIRGSSAIFDACASVFVLEAEKGEPVRVIHEKDRIRGTTLEDFGLRVEDVPHVPFGNDPRGALRIVHLEAEQLHAAEPERVGRNKVLDAVRRILSAEPGFPGKEALWNRLSEDNVCRDHSRAYAAFKELEERGELEEKKEGRKRLLFLVKEGS